MIRRIPATSRPRTSFRWLALLLLILGAARTAQADDKDSERRKQVVEGLLRVLIESQTGGRGGPPRTQLAPPPQLAPGTPELQRARPVLDGFLRESTALSNHLQQQAQTQAALAPLSADVLRLRANAEALQRRSRSVPAHGFILDDARILDRDWRVLSYRLKQTRGLGPGCRASLTQLDDFDAQLCAALNFEPQLDRRSLAQQGQTLAVHFNSLLDDMDIELRRHPRRNELMLAGSQARQLAERFAEDAARGASLPHIVKTWQEFLTVWSPLARTLSGLDSRFIARHLVRIQQVDQQIHELLWLPRGLDRELLLQMSSGIEVETRRVFDQITLHLLLQLPGAGDIPAAADEFHGACQHFVDCVKRDESPDDLVQAYQYLPAAWVAFSRHFRTVDHSGLRQSLADIERRLVALREPLGIPAGISLDDARILAARIEDLAEHLEGDITGWLTGPKYAADQKRIVELSRRLRSAARQLHVALINRAQPQTIEQLTAVVYAALDDLQRGMNECDAPNRDHVVEIIVRMSRELIQLEAMFLG